MSTLIACHTSEIARRLNEAVAISCPSDLEIHTEMCFLVVDWTLSGLLQVSMSP